MELFSIKIRCTFQLVSTTILIYDVFRDEQTADNFHNVDKGCFVSQIERGKRWFIKLPFKLFGVFDTPFYNTYFVIY